MSYWFNITSLDNIVESDLREQVEVSLNMPASYDTVKARAQLAQVCTHLFCPSHLVYISSSPSLFASINGIFCVFYFMYFSTSMRVLVITFIFVRNWFMTSIYSIRDGQLSLPTSQTSPCMSSKIMGDWGGGGVCFVLNCRLIIKVF